MSSLAMVIAGPLLRAILPRHGHRDRTAGTRRITSALPAVRELSSSVETSDAWRDLLPMGDFVSFLFVREWKFAGEPRGLAE
jgi:hypothetical protein